MRITIFGSTGMVGRRLIDRALAHGHEVRAFGRNVFTKLSTERERLELVKGYLFQDDDVEEALKGADAVLSALGGGIDGVDKTRSLGMKHIVRGMEKLGIKRLVAVGGMGILDGPDGKMLYETPSFPPQYRPVTLEHLAAWIHMRDSHLDWTMMCPPDILDQPMGWKLKTACNQFPGGFAKVRAGDLAELMVETLENGEFIHCRVGLGSEDVSDENK
ncbi:MAG: hypothetical protein CMN32_13895 [Saprospirales bacterium]|nr:hypothetical protein [Saprospirales bacterium]